MYAALGKWVGTGLLTGGLWASTVGPAMAADRTEGTGAAPVPIAVTPAVGAAGLDAATPLPGGSVPWAAVAAPPARGPAGGEMLLQGGGGGAPQLRYYALDALGSVRVVFDAAGQVVSRADYEPFGAAVPASTTGTLPRQQYTGHERDGEVGVDYFGARMYVPTLGRMPSVDPLYVGAVAQPRRWNRYAYALNTPTAVIDPDGRCAEWTSDDAVNVCGTGGNASYTHPAYVQEHHPFLFLLMGYSNYGYSGGGSVDMGWPGTPAEQDGLVGEAATNEIASPGAPSPQPRPPTCKDGRCPDPGTAVERRKPQCDPWAKRFNDDFTMTMNSIPGELFAPPLAPFLSGVGGSMARTTWSPTGFEFLRAIRTGHATVAGLTWGRTAAGLLTAANIVRSGAATNVAFGVGLVVGTSIGASLHVVTCD